MIDDQNTTKEKNEKPLDITLNEQEITQKKQQFFQDRSMKNDGFYTGLFVLPFFNIILLIGLNYLGYDVFQDLFKLVVGFNTPLLIIIVFYSFYKINHHPNKKIFYKGLQLGLIFCISIAVIGPLLLFGGCYLMLTGG